MGSPGRARTGSGPSPHTAHGTWVSQQPQAPKAETPETPVHIPGTKGAWDQRAHPSAPKLPRARKQMTSEQQLRMRTHRQIQPSPGRGSPETRAQGNPHRSNVNVTVASPGALSLEERRKPAASRTPEEGYCCKQTVPTRVAAAS